MYAEPTRFTSVQHPIVRSFHTLYIPLSCPQTRRLIAGFNIRDTTPENRLTHTQARDSPEFLPTSATSGSPLAFQEGAQQTSKATVPMYNPGGKGSVLSMFAQPLTEGFYPWAEGLPGGSEGKECTCNADDLRLIPGLGRSPWRRQ